MVGIVAVPAPRPAPCDLLALLLELVLCGGFFCRFFVSLVRGAQVPSPG